MKDEILVDYDVVHEIAGHQSNKGVKIIDAAKDIFKKCKENAMQCAVSGTFIQFDTIDELIGQLSSAMSGGYSI